MKESTKPLLLALILLVLLIWVGIWYEYNRDKCPSIDAETLHWAYCDHMGYERVANESGLFCIFDDGSSCDTWEFFYSRCGEDKVRDIAPRKKCESIYIYFEGCEEGLVPSEQKYLLEQPHCK